MRSSTSWVVAKRPADCSTNTRSSAGAQHVQLAVGADVVDPGVGAGVGQEDQPLVEAEGHAVGHGMPRLIGVGADDNQGAHRHDRPGRPDDRRDRRCRDEVAGSRLHRPAPDARRGTALDRGRLRAVSGSARRHGRQLHPGVGLGESRPVRRRVVGSQRRTCTRWATPLCPFTIQSISKAFVFALVLEAIGADEARRRLGVNSTGLPFNSVMAIELSAGPHDEPDGQLRGDRHDQPRARRHGRGEVGAHAGRPVGASPVASLVVDEDGVRRPSWPPTAATTASPTSCTATSGCGSTPTRPPTSTRRQCSLLVTAHDLAAMGATLANGGVNPLTGARVIAADHCRRVLAVMMTCGLYEQSGDYPAMVVPALTVGIAGRTILMLSPVAFA